MLSLDLLDKVAKRLDFHSTAIIFLDFFDKDQTSLNITRLHSTHSTRWPNGSIFSSIFCRVKNRVKNRVVWPGPNMKTLIAYHNKNIIHANPTTTNPPEKMQLLYRKELPNRQQFSCSKHHLQGTCDHKRRRKRRILHWTQGRNI